MQISELVNQLNDIMNALGDMPVIIDDHDFEVESVEYNEDTDPPVVVLG